MTRRNRITFRHILPSMVTVLAICAGLTSLRMTFDGKLDIALYCILLAAFLDAADGKLARFLDTASRFGAELDTLADFFNFGVAPAVLLYYTFYTGADHANIGWMAAMILAICCALRLARFNIAAKTETTDDQGNDYFVGVPAPAVGSLALLPVFAHMHGWAVTDWPVAQAIYTIVIGLLAVSTIPTFSIKHASIGRGQSPVVITLFSIVAICLINYPWPTLIAANLMYLASLPLSYLSQQNKARAALDAGL